MTQDTAVAAPLADGDLTPAPALGTIRIFSLTADQYNGLVAALDSSLEESFDVPAGYSKVANELATAYQAAQAKDVDGTAPIVFTVDVSSQEWQEFVTVLKDGLEWPDTWAYVAFGTTLNDGIAAAAAMGVVDDEAISDEEQADLEGDEDDGVLTFFGAYGDDDDFDWDEDDFAAWMQDPGTNPAPQAVQSMLPDDGVVTGYGTVGGWSHLTTSDVYDQEDVDIATLQADVDDLIDAVTGDGSVEEVAQAAARVQKDTEFLQDDVNQEIEQAF